MKEEVTNDRTTLRDRLSTDDAQLTANDVLIGNVEWPEDMPKEPPAELVAAYWNDASKP